MDLYFVESQMDAVFNSLGDPELTPEEQAQMLRKFDWLMERKEECLQALAYSYKNDCAAVEACKAEIKRLQEKVAQLTERQERKLNALSKACGEGTTNIGAFTLKSRMGAPKVMCDEDEMLKWCVDNHRDDCLNIKTVAALNKTAIKRCIEAGDEMPAQLVRETSWSLK